MVLEIRLENFFSIKDEVVLDFRAAKINSKTAQALDANVFEFNGQKVLKSVGLFGANAAGKSNIFRALNFCRKLIVDSAQYNEGIDFDFMPFKFDGWQDKPSVFTIDFVQGGIEYEYSFSLTGKEILKESLYYYPRGRPAKVYTRDETKSKVKQEIYSFTDGIIPRPFDVAINTSRKTLFLSRASQMDRDICGKLYLFFKDDFLVAFAPLDYRIYGLDIENLFAQNRDLIHHALAISDSDIAEIKMTVTQIDFSGTPLEGKSKYSGHALNFKTYHKASPSIPFELFSEESAGTKQLFGILFFLLHVIKSGRMFMFDEFDLSLHTKLAEFVIDMFHSGSRAQFVFASHNTNLIDVKRFRRDQILFTAKREDGSTELYSLYDYKDFRENMDAEKGYLQGRFDAIPYIDNSRSALKKLLETDETT